MPSSIVASFAKRTGTPETEVERLWTKAKDIVKDGYEDVEVGSDSYYALVVGILKRMLRIKESKMSKFDEIYNDEMNGQPLEEAKKMSGKKLMDATKPRIKRDLDNAIEKAYMAAMSGFNFDEEYAQDVGDALARYCADLLNGHVEASTIFLNWGMNEKLQVKSQQGFKEIKKQDGSVLTVSWPKADHKKVAADLHMVWDSVVRPKEDPENPDNYAIKFKNKFDHPEYVKRLTTALRNGRKQGVEIIVREG